MGFIYQSGADAGHGAAVYPARRERAIAGNLYPAGKRARIPGANDPLRAAGEQLSDLHL